MSFLYKLWNKNTYITLAQHLIYFSEHLEMAMCEQGGYCSEFLNAL